MNKVIFLSIFAIILGVGFFNSYAGDSFNSLFYFSTKSFAADTNTTSTGVYNYKIYSNSTEFLQNEGKTCKVATDGCNTIQVSDGYLGSSTMKYCEDVYGNLGKETRYCLEDNINLTPEEEVFYGSLRSTLDIKYQRQVDNLIVSYKAYLSHLRPADRVEIHQEIINRVESVLTTTKMTLASGINTGNSEMNKKYMVLSLLRFELKRIDSQLLY